MKFGATQSVICALLMLAWRPVVSTLYGYETTYSDTNCQGTPIRLILREAISCTSDSNISRCHSDGEAGAAQYVSVGCVDADPHEYVVGVFGDFGYVTLELYNVEGCKSLVQSETYLATGICQHANYGDTVTSNIAMLYPNGSALLQLFSDSSCGVDADNTLRPNRTKISSHMCVSGLARYYSSMYPTNSTSSFSNSGSSSVTPMSGGSPTPTTESSNASSDLSAGGIIGIVVGSLVVSLLVIAVFIWRRRSKSKQWHPSEEVESPVDRQCDDSKLNPSYYMSDTTERGTMAEVHAPRGSSMMNGESSSIGGLWDDEAIVAMRIPRKKVFVHELIARDGYAEVFKGTFNGQLVSVKTLHPQTRNNVECVTNFCSEAKMMTTMDHPRIAQLIGVAWDNRMDVCIVSEYLDGGDVRGLLDSFAQLHHPVSFDYDKVKIALHIAHALTYLHSLEPPVIHRNLQSKNVLLSYELDAKLVDFGISREKMDTTMTAGVGSALWMAPEVVMGHRYDEKADIFSFGVVLSELDVHSLPYSHAEAQYKSRHKMPESLILQQVVAGKLQVEFTQTGSAQQLGRDCVAVDPSQRPTAAEVLHKLHQILTHEM